MWPFCPQNEKLREGWIQKSRFYRGRQQESRVWFEETEKQQSHEQVMILSLTLSGY